MCFEDKILLQKRSDKETWGLPGGAIELGESAVETIKREFLEEIGLEIDKVELQNVYTKYKESYPNGDKAQVITIAYIVNVNEIKNIEKFKNSETLKLKFF
ncbi:NUDIX domain-containing protein [Streptococcus phocae subsp. salmonis]